MKTLTLETCELHLFNDLGVIARFSLFYFGSVFREEVN